MAGRSALWIRPSRPRCNGCEAASFNGRLLNEPWEVTTRTGDPMKVFTPFWRAARARGEPAAPLPPPDAITPLPGVAQALAGAGMPARPIDGLGLEPTAPDWAGGIRAAWTPGEVLAKAFVATPKRAIGLTCHPRRDCRRICASARSASGSAGMRRCRRFNPTIRAFPGRTSRSF